MDTRTDIGLPDTLTLNYKGSGFEIVRRWFDFTTIIMTVFVIFWDGFLCLWYSMAVSAAHVDLTALLFPLGHLAIGVALTYRTLAGWINATRVTVDQGFISVRHGPLPWYGNKNFLGGDLKQLYSKEKISNGRSTRSATYEVHVVTNSGKTEPLVTGLDSSEQAIFIEQEIERHFHIEDAPVRGQI
ncbi:MAG: hypothetical protein IT306_16310 [Chloroflexi bacterium]|nr:hypothetical protein [Chloroflexota bacterium]